MNWGSWEAFWAMGGYGLYVCGAFGMTLLCIVVEVGLLRRHRLQMLKRLRRMQILDAQ